MQGMQDTSRFDGGPYCDLASETPSVSLVLRPWIFS